MCTAALAVGVFFGIVSLAFGISSSSVFIKTIVIITGVISGLGFLVGSISAIALLHFYHNKLTKNEIKKLQQEFKEELKFKKNIIKEALTTWKKQKEKAQLFFAHIDPFIQTGTV